MIRENDEENKIVQGKCYRYKCIRKIIWVGVLVFVSKIDHQVLIIIYNFPLSKTLSQVSFSLGNVTSWDF